MKVYAIVEVSVTDKSHEIIHSMFLNKFSAEQELKEYIDYQNYCKTKFDEIMVDFDKLLNIKFYPTKNDIENLYKKKNIYDIMDDIRKYSTKREIYIKEFDVK